MKKKQYKKWQVTFGRKAWLFYGIDAPKVTEMKDDKIRGKNYNMFYIEETYPNN